MRHATSWQKNQSRDDAFGKPLEISTSTTNNRQTIQTVRLQFQTNAHYRRSTEQHIVFIFLLIIIIVRPQSNVDFLTFISLILSVRFSIFVMQQLSNDTGSWTIIDSPIPAPLFYNSSTYDALSNGLALINDIRNPIFPISINLPESLSPPSATIENNPLNYWAFALIVFPIFTIFGNVLVVISVYREKSLHTVTNYFVVSLAISDITVAAVVMPFSIYLEVSRPNRRYVEREPLSYSGALSVCWLFKREMNGLRKETWLFI